MIGWLYRWIVGKFDICEHDWELIRKGPIVDEFDGEVGYYRYWECSKCKKKKKNEWK